MTIFISRFFLSIGKFCRVNTSTVGNLDFKAYSHASTILATGSEVEIACEASDLLLKDNINIRVVSFPSWEIFDKKLEKDKKKILGNKPIFAIEAGVINGWEKYVPAENFIGMNSFGASGPYKELYNHFEITSAAMAKLIKERIL